MKKLKKSDLKFDAECDDLLKPKNKKKKYF